MACYPLGHMKKINRRLLPVFCAFLVFTSTAGAAPRFSGGLCQSQGTWLQDALAQSDSINNAIESLRNDPACKALTAALQQSPKVDAATRSQSSGADVTSYANLHSELSALGDYLKPSQLGAGMNDQQFRDIVYNVVFNKSYEAIKDVNADPDLQNLSPTQRLNIFTVSGRLRAFLARSEEVANLTMVTAQNIVNALPQSQLCLHNRPQAATMIFGSIVHASASLLSGGRVNGVGEFIASLMNFSREMDYTKNLAPLERERFNASVSCLAEATSEAYCSLQDAEDALDFMKTTRTTPLQKSAQINEVLSNANLDSVANPLGGLIILMRDIPIIQAWMQKVLFGIDPRVSAESKMKNDNWQNFVAFIQVANSLQGDFRDSAQMYQDNANTQPREGKLAQLKQIHDHIMGTLAPATNGPDLNFFLRSMNIDTMRFYLIGVESLPKDYNSQTNTFDNFWAQWTQDGSHGFSDPDKLIETMRLRLWNLIDRAKSEANMFFASRMVVDPQNLISEAMNGPGVSTYEAFQHLRTYYTNLNLKLNKSASALATAENVRRRMLLSQGPLLKDSIHRLDKIIQGLESLSEISGDTQEAAMVATNRKIMDMIYDTANMMISRDSFFGTRMQTALQADLSDTLWSHASLTDRQSQLLYTLGSDIVTRLSAYFGTDPVLQRTDLSSAKIVQITNLQTVESMFGRVMYQQILKLNCDLKGGVACQIQKRIQNSNFDPMKDAFGVQQIAFELQAEAKHQSILRLGFVRGLQANWYHDNMKPMEDSTAHHQLLAKLCLQTLAFQARDIFTDLCQGTSLVSEFSQIDGRSDLDMSYDSMLKNIHQILNAKSEGHLDQARNVGVCALRSYFRKNHVFEMHKDYESSSAASF